MTDDLHEGSKEVSKAIEYRKSSRKRWRWCCLLFFLLLVIIGVLVYFYAVKPILDEKNKQANVGNVGNTKVSTSGLNLSSDSDLKASMAASSSAEYIPAHQKKARKHRKTEIF